VDHEKCIKCGTCIQSCFVENIAFFNGKIYINHDNCKGCGQCVASCPQKALTAEIDNVDEALAELNLRIKQRITID
jgi:MinD superfamily P-loop ATPase